jgi:lycopene cyclase domain-containing protein
MFGHYSYLIWMFIFTLLPIGILWTRYGRRLWRNRNVIALVAVIAVLYQLVADPFAEAWHAWSFGNDKILGIWVANFPIENTVFFVLVSIAVSSFVTARAGRKL